MYSWTVNLNAVKAYGMVIQAFLSVGAKWREGSASCSVRCNLRETPLIPVHYKGGWSQKRSGRFGGERNLLALPVIEPRFLGLVCS